MPQITIAAAGGYETIDGVIETFSHGLRDNISHIAMILAGNTWEAQGVIVGNEPYPGFWPQRWDRLVNKECVKLIAVDVPDLAPILKKAQELKGTPYGYGDCFRGGIYELTGKQIPDSEFTVDCSESITRCMRTVIPILPEITETGCITPEKMYKYLREVCNGIDITRFVEEGGTIPGLDFSIA